MADAFSFVCFFDDAGYVGHDEGAGVAVFYDAQVGYQCGEGVAGYFGFGGGYYGEECGLAGIGKSHQPYVGEYFKFEDFPFLFAGFAGLGVAGCLVGGRFEVGIAQATAPPAKEDLLLVVLGDLEEEVAGFRVFGDGAEGYIQYDVFAIGARAVALAPVAPFFGDDMFAVFERQEGPHMLVTLKKDMAATATVAAVGAALWVGPGPQKMGRPRSPRS